MQDAMKQSDDVAVSLECAHPGVKAGEVCQLCGKTLQPEASTNGTAEGDTAG